ncbi:MAG: MFS transporter, partial [Sphingomonadales bacterium]|nr:MFS transporter [Sphingomonadales bacterium]
MALSPARRWLLLATVAVGLLLITLDNSILYTALPTLTRELHASAMEGLWIINAYPLVMAGLLLGAGALGDRVGHRLMFLVGLVLFGLASLVAAFSPTAEVLIGARAFLAVGAAAMMPATLALIRVTFMDERERNFAIAIWGSISLIGAALGPILGGFLLEQFWWGAVFLVNVPIVVLAFTATLILAPRVAADPTKTWDLWSSVLALVALAAAVFALKELAHAPISFVKVGFATVLAVLAGWVFVSRQQQLPYPLLDFSIFRNLAFSAGVIAAAMIMFAVAGVQLVTTQRFQLVAGFSAIEAGLMVSALAIGAIPLALLGGAMLHRIGLRNLVAGGLAFASVATAATALMLDMGTLWVVVGMTLSGAGLGAAMSVTSTAIMGNAPVHRAGMAASVEEVSYEFGNLFAVVLLGTGMAALYTAVVVLPSAAPASASDSIGGALEYAATLSGGGSDIVAAARTAFDRSYFVVMMICAVGLALGALATAWLLRRYGPG